MECDFEGIKSSLTQRKVVAVREVYIVDLDDEQSEGARYLQAHIDARHAAHDTHDTIRNVLSSRSLAIVTKGRACNAALLAPL